MNPLLIGVAVFTGIVFILGHSAKSVVAGYGLILILGAAIPLINGDPGGFLVSVLCLVCLYELLGQGVVFYRKGRPLSIAGIITGGGIIYLMLDLLRNHRWHEGLAHSGDDVSLFPLAILATGILLLRLSCGNRNV